MPTSMNVGGAWQKLVQPYVQLSPGQWTKLKTMYANVGGVWREVWPGVRIYIWTGTGYALNMFHLFGSPVDPANFIFINQGIIGGGINAYGENCALDTGTFPNGSTLTFINQGRVAGKGGQGAWYNANRTFVAAGQGGAALRLRNYLTIDNTAGTIRGGGGGAGAAAEWGGSNDNNAPGGGGAGIPGGPAGALTWYPGYTYAATAGSELSPGTNTGYGVDGRGGAPGQPGTNWRTYIGSSRNLVGPGSPGGAAILGSGYLLSGTGMDGSRVVGAWQ